MGLWNDDDDDDDNKPNNDITENGFCFAPAASAYKTRKILHRSIHFIEEHTHL